MGFIFVSHIYCELFEINKHALQNFTNGRLKKYDATSKFYTTDVKSLRVTALP